MGGGVRIGAAPALVTDSTFRRNTAKSGGALATNSGSKTQVRNSLFECNSSNISGSGVVTSGNTVLGC
jgi:predicted outer membrane repeat protein